MIYKSVTLKRGKEDSLRRFHPWVFSGAIAAADDTIEEGDLVTVYAHDGTLIGNGHSQIGSIAVRMLTFDDTAIDEAFYAKRLEDAYRMRQALGLQREDNNAFRLVHGEGDFLPGLVVDIYGPTAVMQAHSPGMHFARNMIAQALTQLPDGIVRNVYYKSETTLPYKAHLDPINDYIIGNMETDEALENGLRFHVDWLKGQKTGFFVDQRENRALVEHFARGRRVLNMFCYTGGFSFYAMRGGAELVHSVDVSKQAISITNANVELNFPGDPRHSAYAADAFDFLKNPGRFTSIEGTFPYDLVILDPPAFAKHKKVLHNALRGYQKLNAAALERMPSGSILFTFSCSQVVTKDDFRCAVFSAAAQVGRRVRILYQLHQPADHPINIYHPEGEYLKGLVLYVE